MSAIPLAIDFRRASLVEWHNVRWHAIGKRRPSVNETFAGRPKQFLADLTQAMRSAAEAGQTTVVEQARANAESYIEGLRQEATGQQSSLREAAAEDVAQLRDQSKAQAQLVREESERRIRQRRQVLDDAIAEYARAEDAELKRVEEQVAAWELELGKFYTRLADETDPTIFASLASTMPNAPEYGDADPGELVRRMRSPQEFALAFAPGSQPVELPSGQPEPAQASESEGALPDHWWLDARFNSRGSS